MLQRFRTNPTTATRRRLLMQVAALPLAICAALWLPGASATAQEDDSTLHPSLRGTGITEQLGETIPKDLSFVDETGEPVTLGDYLGLDRPVILTLNYYRCPHLCKMTLNALVNGMREMEWTPGRDFEIVTVSINPEEGPSLAKANKIGYLALYERPEAESGWHFLTGDEQNIRALADAVGFGYRYDEKSGEYVHSSTIIFLTPGGRVSRYINDLQFPRETLRTALVEAGEGTIGSFIEQALIRCFLRYDPNRGEYAVAAEWIMYFGGIITVLAIGAGLITAWRLDVRRQRRDALDDDSSLTGQTTDAHSI